MSAELEFLVLEGQAKGQVFSLRAESIELGRKDPFLKQDPPTRISFPDPTVSGLHATLTWDPKRNRYLLTHRSTTNHTLINGKVVQSTQYIHVGDKIKMGSLVIQLRLIPQAAPAVPVEVPTPSRGTPAQMAKPEPVPTPPPVTYQLLVLNGPDAGRLHPIQHETVVLQEEGAQQTFEPTIHIQGAGQTRCLLLAKQSDIHVTCAESGLRPVLIDQPLAGVVRQRNPGPEFGNLLNATSLLLVGKIAVILVQAEEAVDMRNRLLAGEQVSPLQAGLFREGDRIWNRGELHQLRFTAGPLKGTQFWIDHRKVERALSLGRIGQKTLVELTDRGAVSCEIDYKNDAMTLTNMDNELSLPVNGEEIAPGQSHELHSGDSFRLGRTVVSYHYLPVQQRIDTYSIFWGVREYPLRRTVNVVGQGPNCEINLEDDSLTALTGRIVVSESSLRYQHRQPGMLARVEGQELHAGEEAKLKLDYHIQLGNSVELRLGRRTAAAEDPEG